MHTQKVKSDYKVVDISKITKKKPHKTHDRKQILIRTETKNICNSIHVNGINLAKTWRE